jgi:AcrR family transcriptional regulator
MHEISRKDRERLAREGEILDAAEKVFGSKGYEGALMDDIAREAQFTRKTLYQHFGGKEELLSAVILRGFRLLLAYAREGIDERASGFERLRAMGRTYYRFYREHTGFFGLINYSSRMKALGAEAQRGEFAETDKALFQIIARAIADGQADGSIRTDMDAAMATASVVFTMTGFFIEYSLTGKSFTEHLSMDRDRFVQYTLDLLLDAFRPAQAARV